MKQSTIYKIETHYLYSLSGIRPANEVVSYFSNLKRAIEAIQASLAIHGWEVNRINYTAAYRALNQRNKYVVEFQVKGVKFFKLSIEKVTLNPLFTTLGIGDKPT